MILRQDSCPPRSNKKDDLWVWKEVHQAACDAIERQITDESTLLYYDVTKDSTRSGCIDERIRTSHTDTEQI